MTNENGNYNTGNRVRLHLENGQSWRWTGICGGGYQPVLALLVLIDTGLLSFRLLVIRFLAVAS